ncbi:OLC1v1036732C1 [Oldenlandia corymbosa var. corymbosa]|uniref:OLC1v1036732C1 n=1 Tax=Oldenlandia corymbosa var. corymbosa TaxID=529605 RepID=A0AAV1CW35_OLDCO|nr:OLC1v1036732C1 [Oldenlandia corymbosa var. corymbosa]
MAKKMAADVAVVMVPLPAQGHLNQLLHLSHLISGYGFPVHFVGTPTHNRQARVRVHGWDPKVTSKIQFHDFPAPPFPTPPPNPNTSDKLPVQLFPSFHAIIHLRQPICELIQKLSVTSKRVVVIHDSLMVYVIQDVPTIANAESYTFQSVSAFAMYTYYWEMAGKPVIVNGETINDLLISVRGGDFPKEFAEFMQLQIESRKHNWGNLYNTSRVIDGEFLDSVAQEPPYSAEKHWAIGPFNPPDTTKSRASEKRHNCLEWLDNQPTNSVIFVSFGSTTSLCDKQIREIAVGLDNSGAKFIWVLRDADRADVFLEETRRASLPEGVGDWGHEGELVKADEIEEVVKRLMNSGEGEEMRKKAAEIREEIKKPVEKVADGNSGTTEMDAFVAHITR